MMFVIILVKRDARQKTGEDGNSSPGEVGLWQRQLEISSAGISSANFL